MSKPTTARKGTSRAALPPSAGRLTKRGATGASKKHLKLVENQQEEATAASEPVDIDFVDTSRIIVDYDELRAKATEAYGDYASKALGDGLMKKIQDRKQGANNVLMVHPLDVHIAADADRLNTRDFNTERMKKRVRLLTDSVAVKGVEKPLLTYMKNNMLFIVGGESRYRAVLHASIMATTGEVVSAPQMIPITITKLNDVNLVLAVDSDNDQEPMTPLEKALLYRHAVVLGAKPADIARRAGRSYGHVSSLLSMLEMPEAVLNMVKEGTIMIAFAYKKWTENDKDAGKTLEVLNAAVETARLVGSDRVMPKHDLSEKKTAATSTGQGSTGRGRKSGAGDAGQPDKADAGSANTEDGGGNTTSGELTSTASSLKKLLNAISSGGVGGEPVAEDGFVTCYKFNSNMTIEEFNAWAAKVLWTAVADDIEEEDTGKKAA